MTNDQPEGGSWGDRRADVESIVDHVMARDSALLDVLAAGEDPLGPSEAAPIHLRRDSPGSTEHGGGA